MTTSTHRLRRLKRSRAALFGTASRPRLAVSRTAKHFSAQLIDDLTGHTLAALSDVTAHSQVRGIPQATEVGKAMGELARQQGISTAVLDRRGHRYHGRLKAFADAIRATGIKI
ncbi:50S ribosomal protein L18 [Candidatus Berkelbacteria bacterium]|nr:50S ribosomal protein L18 [Candidatus Berkelbacteria bacterium]